MLVAVRRLEHIDDHCRQVAGACVSAKITSLRFMQIHPHLVQPSVGEIRLWFGICFGSGWQFRRFGFGFSSSDLTWSPSWPWLIQDTKANSLAAPLVLPFVDLLTTSHSLITLQSRFVAKPSSKFNSIYWELGGEFRRSPSPVSSDSD